MIVALYIYIDGIAKRIELFEDEKISWDSGKWVTSDPYILIYSYHGDMNSKNEVCEITRIAKEKGPVGPKVFLRIKLFGGFGFDDLDFVGLIAFDAHLIARNLA